MLPNHDACCGSPTSRLPRQTVVTIVSPHTRQYRYRRDQLRNRGNSCTTPLKQFLQQAFAATPMNSLPNLSSRLASANEGMAVTSARSNSGTATQTNTSKRAASMRFTHPRVFSQWCARVTGAPKKQLAGAPVSEVVPRPVRLQHQLTSYPQGRVPCLKTDRSDRPWLTTQRRTTMQIHGINQLHGVQGINAPHINRVHEAATPATPSHIDTTDELHLSPAA
jgi:hypothetical protein